MTWFVGGTGRGVARNMLFALSLLVGLCTGMRLHRPFSEESMCEKIVKPHWPFSYAKEEGQQIDNIGRTASSLKHIGHPCTTRGVNSKCHYCEEFPCGDDLGDTCYFQLQGVDPSKIRGNILTIGDTPWAIGGSHRNDFGSPATTHVCVLLSGGPCVRVDLLDSFDHRTCSIRCWGYGAKRPVPGKVIPIATVLGLSTAEGPVNWDYSPKEGEFPQGKVSLLAGSGSGEAGHRDGPRESALFNFPTSVAVDRERNVYVADSGNHVIRRIDAVTGVVTTLAGVAGKAGFKDGLVSGALFDTPHSIALYYDWGVKYDPREGMAISNGIGELVLVISDKRNHRIRRIIFKEGLGLDELEVETLAGRRGYEPVAGYADGDASEARFNLPLGLAVDDAGIVFVADSHNHLIRRVMPNGDVFTLAGKLGPSIGEEDEESCPPPCMRGIHGDVDGDLANAQFSFPSDVAINLENTILVTDANRIRLVTRNGTVSYIQGQRFENQVFTIAGQSSSGKIDGTGEESYFNHPKGVSVDTLTGRVFVADTTSCRVRRLSSAMQTAKPLSCEVTLTNLVRPSGCTSFDTPVDSLNLKATDVTGNIQYNYKQRKEPGLLGNWSHAEFSYQGRKIHNCQGSPPLPGGASSTGESLGPNWDTKSETILLEKEDTDFGTSILIFCPPGCREVPTNVFGTDLYTDDSSICRAALHSGLISNEDGGLLRVVVEFGDPFATFPGSTAHGVTTLDKVGGWNRLFAFEEYLERQVQVATIAGVPAAPLESPCGTMYGPEAIPLVSRFNMPQGVTIRANQSLSTTEFLYISDTDNHAIRIMTGTCAKICENGGTCTGDEQCTCRDGWEGEDCTKPVCTTPCSSTRSLCVAPDTCACVSGYTNYPACTTPLCVQECKHGGHCSAPDVCTCQPGWFDSNCTTPICEQTCGNGGNCTSPNTCTCPIDWIGEDCRTPVCRQTCQNGGECIAPDTCTCPPKWSGHDCSLPVCTQGYLVPDPSNFHGSTEAILSRGIDSLSRPVSDILDQGGGLAWTQYTPCDDSEQDSSGKSWCDITQGFDCAQLRHVDPQTPLRGGEWRSITGFNATDGTVVSNTSNCVRIELSIGVRTPFPYEKETGDNDMTPLYRYTPSTPYGWNASFALGPHTKEAWDQGVRGWQSSGPAAPDRYVAHVKWQALQQGVYICANGGNCTAPDVCSCAPGWTGFDCRIPICEQGYYQPPSESNPGFVEMEDGSLVKEQFPNKGLYECSIRSYTEWENPDYLHEHPNYYSRYMDHHPTEWHPEKRYQLEPETPLYWDGMGWAATYEHLDPLGNDTNKGWTRKGYWVRKDVDQAHWRKGKCTIEYTRECPDQPSKGMDVRSLLTGAPVRDTLHAFRPVIKYTDKKARAVGRWSQIGGICVDHVHRGCKNNGTCVGPNICECAEGWTGHDCTIPICEQPCTRRDDEDLGYDNNKLKIFSRGKGWCTLPNTCTCEKGWSGHDCSVALCAQECNNNGKCIAPDACSCARWFSSWRDNRLDGGRPLFQDGNGDPQLTGWTGYDCNTPICVQAKRWVVNDEVGSLRLGGYGLILHGDEPYNNIRRPDISSPPYLPYQLSNDIPPVKIFLPALREHNLGLWALEEEFLEEPYRLCRMQKYRFCSSFPDASPLRPTWSPGDGEVVRNDGRSYQTGCRESSVRFSDEQEGVTAGYLCNVLQWEQGDYDSGRHVRQSNDATMYVVNDSITGPITISRWVIDQEAPVGEGVYECFNKGSCVAPDQCSCPDGYGGGDCSTPLCRHRQFSGQVVSCLKGGICSAKDNCTCVQTDSILHQTYKNVKPGKTGYNGTDCSIPMCSQGVFDPLCRGVTPGGEGCFRCLNGGNCTAPDFCTCPPEWTGHDCGIPVCTLRADDSVVLDLQTSDVKKVQRFEMDPCQTSKLVSWDGLQLGQGNCTAPNTCTCLCTNRAWQEEGEYTELPWADPLGRELPPGYIAGTLTCVDGFEGIKDFETTLFKSCHLKIYVPLWYERYSITLIVLSSLLFVMGIGAYIRVRRKTRQKYMLARAERKLTGADGQVVPTRERKGGKKKAKKKRRRTERKVA
mmetsp:Transcript_34542/g.55147  ORF Transcript_34542/g.55147 Transcript_34542/m.55147 type:complete len:2065 (+) Transcript_34542:19-6213(+)